MHTILNQLKGSIGYYLSQKSIADNLLQQRASLPNISFGPNGESASPTIISHNKTPCAPPQASKTSWS